jgi:hypothetical protein
MFQGNSTCNGVNNSLNGSVNTAKTYSSNGNTEETTTGVNDDANNSVSEDEDSSEMAIDGQEYILSTHKTNNLVSKPKTTTKKVQKAGSLSTNDDSIDVSNLISQYRLATSNLVADGNVSQDARKPKSNQNGEIKIL